MEAALGLYALAFLGLLPLVHRLYGVLERAFEPSYQSFSLIKLGLAFALLIVPTTLMGGTLPVLSRYLGMERPAQARRLVALYSCNTAGAVAGCLLFAFWWILLLGVAGSVVLAAGLNLLLALASLGLHRFRGPLAAGGTASPGGDQLVPAAPPGEDLGSRPALLIAFLSGFVVLACEVMWTRLMVNFLSGNALIFATVLAAVLTGLAAGGFLAAFLVGRCRRLAPILAGALLRWRRSAGGSGGGPAAARPAALERSGVRGAGPAVPEPVPGPAAPVHGARGDFPDPDPPGEPRGRDGGPRRGRAVRGEHRRRDSRRPRVGLPAHRPARGQRQPARAGPALRPAGNSPGARAAASGPLPR